MLLCNCFAARHLEHRFAVDDGFVTDQADGFHGDETFFGVHFSDFDVGGNGIADTHGGFELERLRNIYAAGSRQAGSENGRYEGGRKHTVGDSAFEAGFSGEFLVDVNRVEIAEIPAKLTMSVSVMVLENSALMPV